MFKILRQNIKEGENALPSWTRMGQTMINKLAAQNGALSFIQTAIGNLRAQNQSLAKNKSEPADLLLAGLEKSDPARARALKDEQVQLKQTLRQLQSSKTDINEQRKEAARQKIERLKAQILALRMMAAGDPKAAARQAARLARELASAAKEYAAASRGAGSASNVLSGALATTTANSLAAMTAVATVDATTANPAQAEPVQSVTPAITTTGVVAENTTVGDTGSAATDTKAVEAATKDLAAADDDKTAFREKINERIAEANKRVGARGEDLAFVQEVRRLTNELKNIIKAAKQNMRHEDGDGIHRDIVQAENALRNTEKSLSDISMTAVNVLA
jgi:hypothetical protein